MVGKNYLGIVDYSVVVGTLLFPLGIGVYYALKGKNKSNNDELLVGSRNMGAIPVAASILVSYLSAITILGYPSELYSYGLQAFLGVPLGVITDIIGIMMFVRVLYDLKITSTNTYLELRYNSIVVRWLGSLIFIIQLLFTTSIVLYAPSIALETMMGLPMWMSVVGIGICGTIYTSIGGIKAVVWTDVFQFFMIFVGMSAIVVKGIYSAGGMQEMFKVAGERGRLEFFNWTIDPFMRHNTLNIVLGGGVAGISYLVHQPVVQRYCALPTFKDAVKSILFSNVFGVATIGLMMLSGISIFAHFANCDPLSSHQIELGDQIVPFFVIKELSFIPGMMGLFVAVIFSAVLSTISSSLNSLAAVTWEDFLSKIIFFSSMGDAAQANTYKSLTVIYGVVCISLAFLSQHFGTIFQASSTVITTSAGVLGSVYIMGVFMPFVNKKGAITGLVSGIIIMSFIATKSLILQKTHTFQVKLPTSIESCTSDSIEFYDGFNSTSYKNETLPGGNDLDWPEKLYTISYMLYSFFGCLISLFVGIIVSIITGGIQQAKYIRPEYLHPIIRSKTDKIRPRNPKAEINLAYDPDIVIKEQRF